jgi:two-component system, cell cycle response regulator
MSESITHRADDGKRSLVDSDDELTGASANSTGHILLVDDSRLVRAMVRKHLVGEGYLVDEAEDGEVALRLCRQERPDIVLMNVEMPVLDGRQTLMLMKADDALRDIPVIFLTGRTSSEEMVAGLKMGAHDYLRKPFEPSELIARVSAALRVARLQRQLSMRNAELDSLSRIDVLTGLHNRRHGDEYLVVECGRAVRGGRSIAVLMLDIDLFKSINDRYGHSNGDVVLREFAVRVVSVLRQGDLVARWGGEEFLGVLPDTDLKGAVVLAERILRVVRERPVALGDGTTCALTVSIGVASGTGKDPESLLKIADNALYAAKAEGRDRLCIGS